MIELIFGKKNYSLSQTQEHLKSLKIDSKYLQLILRCLNSVRIFTTKFLYSFNSILKDPEERPEFSEILECLDELLQEKYDLELIAQKNKMEELKEMIHENAFSPTLCDRLKRTIFHQCCIFNNLEMLKYLTNRFGPSHLRAKDIYQTSTTHMAARNGSFEILQFLDSHGALSIETETRFKITPLDIAISMKHLECSDFLISRSSIPVLSSALLNASSEGNFDLVVKLVEHGADLEHRMEDIGATPLDRAR